MSNEDSTSKDATGGAGPRLDFIREIIKEDLASGKHETTVTRFPPEPNGYLHIGHAKALCLSFGIAGEIEGGTCHLRFDDTNPTKEETEYVDSIQEDIRWLGFSWGDHLYYASDYFDRLFEWALELIDAGKAYVDDLTPEQIRELRGTLTEPGKNSPNRDRPAEESRDLFLRMRDGEFADGSMVLRARIDMASPNLNMRDPVLYRILRATHHRTGDKWCIYPMYDFTHPLSDAIEHITHSLCSLEFENHRPLYDWCVDNVSAPSKPRQIEFARLNLTYTVMSKRKLLQLVADGHVPNWDDPRMPSLSGFRRRGYSPASIRNFCATIGMTKVNSMTDIALLEHSVREDLNKHSLRYMAVLNPLKVVITNYPDDQVELMNAVNNPEDPEAGKREVPLSKEIWIERDDFMEDPPKKFFRLAPGREVRLRYSYCILCEEVVKDPETGEITELRCSYDPDTLGKNPEGRKVKAAIHWVSARHAVEASVRLYDRLFSVENPDGEEGDFKDYLNPDSLALIENAQLEPALAAVEPESRVQFERLGYFCADREDHEPGSRPVFNRTVALRDSWAKIQKSK